MKQHHRILAIMASAALLVQLAACTPGAPEESASPEAAPESSLSESEPESSEEPAPPESAPPAEPAAAIEPESSSEPALEAPLTDGEIAALENPDGLFPETPSTALSLNPSDITIYVQDPGQYTVSDFNNEADIKTFAAAINGLEIHPGGAVAESGNPDASYLLVRSDHTKFQYALKGDVLTVDGDAHSLIPQDATLLKSLADSQVCSTYAQWLIYMRPSRVTGVFYRTGPDEPEANVVDSELQQALVYTLRNFHVSRGSGATFKPGSQDYSTFDYQFKLNFDSGVVYTVTLNGSRLLVESSDMNFGCSYEIADLIGVGELSGLVGGTADILPEESMDNPATDKPVIYLYPEKTTDVNVRLDFKGRLGFTFPTYNDGWQVTARPDGTLTNKADGTTHYYLFWDGVPDRTQWDFSRGFVVKDTEVQAFLQEKLPALGLTPREYNDFITYWVPLMMKNPYNLVTFSTGEYEQTAPLTVSPAPDTLLRVHMVYKPLSTPVEVEEQVLPAPPERKGFTVVEWGGTRLG